MSTVNPAAEQAAADKVTNQQLGPNAKATAGSTADGSNTTAGGNAGSGAVTGSNPTPHGANAPSVPNPSDHGTNMPALPAAQAPNAIAQAIAAASNPENPEFHGIVEGPFTIYGKDFGTEKGTVALNDHPCEVTAWRDDRIKGRCAVGVKKGPVTVRISSPQGKVGTLHGKL